MRSASFIVLLSVPMLAQASGFPGGVLDTTGRAAFLSAGDGIVAIDLTNGQRRWRSGEGTEPLFVVGDRLFALATSSASRLFIRGIDLSERAGRVFESEPIELPRWAIPENTPGRTFSFEWTREKTRLDLTWRVAEVGPKAPHKRACGAVSVDLTTGKVIPREHFENRPEPLPRVLETLFVRWRSTTAPLRALVMEQQVSNLHQRHHAVFFRRWDERGRELPAQELLQVGDLIVLADVTNNRLWLRDGMPMPDRESKTPPSWLVIDATDGHEIVRVPVVPGTIAATIHDKRAYFLTPGSVRIEPDRSVRRGKALSCVDLETGKLLWRTPVQ